MTRPAALVAAGLLLTGCASPPLGPVFPPISPRVVWPAPPDEPRIEYLGSLAGEAGLGVRPAGWEALRLALAGEQPRYARFVTPLAVAVAGETVYVADPAAAGGPCVHVLDLERRTYGAIRIAAGEPLAWPIDVAASRGRLAVVDARRAAVFLFDAAGRFLTTLGSGALQRPVAAAWNDATGDLWVVDATAHALVSFADDGAVLRRAGTRGAGPGQFNYPAGIAVRSASIARSRDDRTPDAVAAAVLVADAMNFRVVRLGADGEPLGWFGRKGDAAGCFSLPRDVAFDRDGHIYALDNQFENVQVFDAAGRLLMAWGEEGRGPGQFYLPSGITIDDRNRIWIADTYNRRVQVFRFISPHAAPDTGH